jgi:hypothetical protein
MANLTRLLFYLKRDSGLVVVTAEQQLALSELISETYTFIIQDTERRITKILGPAMLEHEEIPGMDQVDFTDDWHRFFRKSARRSVMVPPDGVIAVQATSDISPQSITSLLSSTLFVLQSYDVHPIIIIQTLAQFFHYISCELFNRIMTNKKLLCRSKAMQVRMNLSHLEDWISVNKLPVNLLSYLNPTTQLLQLLQCLTHLQDLMDFINTSKKFDALNASQIKRCVISYRYEVSEPHIPEEIEKYAMQCAEDTVRYVQSRRQSMDKAHISRRHHQHKSSNKKLGDSTTQSKLPPIQDEEEDEDIKETKDAKFMLPFSVPTTAHMMSVQHWDKQEHSAKSMIPFIPEEWMDKLDKEQKQDS